MSCFLLFAGVYAPLKCSDSHLFACLLKSLRIVCRHELSRDLQAELLSVLSCK